MTIETLQHPETKTIYRIYYWCEHIADWKCAQGYHDQAEALRHYADALNEPQTYKLTKETTQDLLIKGE